MRGKCKNCKYWNDFEHTYVTPEFNCCSFFHIAYKLNEGAANRVRDCFSPRKHFVQLTLNFNFEL